MIERILVPLDGSRFSERILAAVHRLVARCGDAEVMLLGVVTPGRGKGDIVQESCERLERERRKLAEKYGARARFDLMTGDPVDGILAFARTYHPSLIAMATHGRDGLTRWMEGSVTEEVLRRSTYPVLACNPYGLETAESGGPRWIGKILVPLDGSERSGAMVPLVAALARLCGSSVTLFHAAHPLSVELEYGIELPIRNEDAAVLLEPALSQLRAALVPVRVLAVLGSPAHAILDVAEAEKFDLVAMATHGRSGVARVLFGSVAEEVLRRCKCPILVQRTVPAPASGRIPASEPSPPIQSASRT